MSVSRTRTTKPRTVRVNPTVPAPKIVMPATPPEPEPQPLLHVFVAGNPLSANHMYGARGYGAARRLTPEARAWREAIAKSVLPWRFAEEAPRPTLAVSCIFLGARADVDNLLKLALDGIKDGLLVDDKYVMKVCAEKQPLPVRGERGAWIEVSQLPSVTRPRARTRNQRTA